MSFTLMPFLYQTRTILRLPPHRASATVLRSLHATTRRPKETTIPFDYEVGRPGEDIPVADAPVRGTITPSERQIFERIFADIEARGLKPAVSDHDAHAPTTESGASRSVRLIMQEAAVDAGQGRPATVASPAVLSGTSKDRAKALLRFPPQLRGAASKALETIKQQALKGRDYEAATYDTSAVAAGEEEDDMVEDHWKAPAHTFARTVELESKRRQERTRVEGLITSAASDFELWDILEREVFTMPARLGIVKGAAESDGSEPSPKQRGRGHNTTAESSGQASSDAEPNLEADETAEADSASSDNAASSSDAQNLSLYIHGPLYPAYLLLALRRLDTAFYAPSPLVFSILPRIKELGLESYVLGVSTPFFNELLTIYWTRRGDLSGMLELLEEMRHCGLYFDTRTAAILNQVDKAVAGLAKGRSGLGQTLMLMPEFEKLQRERIRHWHRIVDISAQERQDDIGFAEATGV